MPTTTPQADPLALVAADMTALDGVIAQHLHSQVPLVGQVTQYIIGAGGKRLRPALLLLMAGALEVQGPQRLTLAAVVEFIHTATLLHDDVVDESTLRRGRATANQAFGNPASVLVGDFLYSRAFQMMVDVNDMRVMHVLADATNVIAEGEVLQLVQIRNTAMTEDDYLQVIRSKTAKLFEASARLPALLAHASEDLESACALFGQALGTAFQVVDDALDYSGDAAAMGKNLGDDLREGKVTLPLICTLQRVADDERELLENAIREGDVSQLPRLLALIRDSGGLSAALALAHAEARVAQDALRALPHNRYTDAMHTLTEELLQRAR
ncbi:MAG: polyprenyl synthetase family protein [Proteobacteria bacterium]|nr:polyprenyl synthetase family protein [Pseudomonadota bacterium]MDA1327805.1 polyprenyl synthetase family protein [Pseudomonadota bacterium]